MAPVTFWADSILLRALKYNSALHPFLNRNWLKRSPVAARMLLSRYTPLMVLLLTRLPNRPKKLKFHHLVGERDRLATIKRIWPWAILPGREIKMSPSVVVVEKMMSST